MVTQKKRQRKADDVSEIFVFKNSEEGKTAALDSMVALCPCKFNCSEIEACECDENCPCAMKGDSFCRALCGGAGFGF